MRGCSVWAAGCGAEICAAGCVGTAGGKDLFMPGDGARCGVHAGAATVCLTGVEQPVCKRIPISTTATPINGPHFGKNVLRNIPGQGFFTFKRRNVGTSRSSPSTIVGSIFSNLPRATGSNWRVSCLIFGGAAFVAG